MGRPAKELSSYPNRIREWRIKLRLAPKDIARALGHKPGWLTRKETAERGCNVAELEQIARVMRIRAALLLNSTVPVEDEQEQALLALFRQLPAGERDRLLKLARALLPAGDAAD